MYKYRTGMSSALQCFSARYYYVIRMLLKLSDWKQYPAIANNYISSETFNLIIHSSWNANESCTAHFDTRKEGLKDFTQFPRKSPGSSDIFGSVTCALRNILLLYYTSLQNSFKLHIITSCIHTLANYSSFWAIKMTQYFS